MSENRVLKQIFGVMRDEMPGGWRKKNTEKVHHLYSSPNVVRMTKLREKWTKFW
jgi:hypothetical protein